MKESRYFYVPDAIHQKELSHDEAMHAIRVLRLCGGDEIFLIDGVGNFHKAVVTLASQKHCCYEIQQTFPQEREWRGRIHLAIAPTKMMDRMEWMTEKATEVGFDELSFLNCKFSERTTLRTDRIEKIVVAAVKQSRKAWVPQVNDMEDFRQFVSKELGGHKYIAHCYDEIERQDLFSLLQTSDTGDDVTILIGPEGDFSIDEVRLAMEHGFTPVSLGKSRLRTETAGLSAVMMSHLILRKINTTND